MSDNRKTINKDVFNAVSDFFYRMLAPEIKEITSPDNIIVSIGGSVSYGFADQCSDVDVFIIRTLTYPLYNLYHYIQATAHMPPFIVCSGKNMRN